MPVQVPATRLFVSVGHLQGREISVAFANNLQSHWQAPATKSCRHINNRTTGQCAGNNNFHPAMIRIHTTTVDLIGPMKLRIKRENLRSRQDQEIVLGKRLS